MDRLRIHKQGDNLSERPAIERESHHDEVLVR